MTNQFAKNKNSFQETHLPRSFRLIRLELAREPEHPEGSRSFGYLLCVPLNVDGKIDITHWNEFRDFYRVLKFLPNQTNEIGHLVNRPDGSWALHYDIAGDNEDEAGFHFADEHFVPGEYVSIREGKKTRVYKVSTVEHL